MSGIYNAPGVYIEDTPEVVSVQGVSTTIGGMLGITQRGSKDKPILVTSWNSYIETFAQGMDSPFLRDSDLAYSVYGFFQNGGKMCYIQRVASDTASKAILNVPESEPTLSLIAKDEGVWGNKLKIEIVANEDEALNFNLNVKYNDELVEQFTNLSNDIEADNYWLDTVSSTSVYIQGVSGVLSLMASTAFTNGNDGVSDITDTNYIEALSKFDMIDDVNMIAIPGQTSVGINTAIITYCDNRKDVFPILDAPKASTRDTLKDLRKTINAYSGCLVAPYIQVTDALSNVGKLRDCPISGHVMGVYARIITDRGVWKAPAGTEAVVKGAINVLTSFTEEDTAVLNPVGVITVLAKKNYGLVIWGARSLNNSSSMKYVSDNMLDMYIKKSVYESSQPFVFEASESRTWTRIQTAVETFLNELWINGGLYGETASEAYYVKCDAEINTKAVRESGQIICEVGYANSKPGEFVIFRFSKNISS